MMIVSGLHSQNDTGKVWIPRQDALRKLAQADSLPSYKQLVLQKQADINLLTARIDGLQEIISNLKEKDSLTVASYNTQFQVMKEQRALFEDQLNGYEKLLKRERRKRFWTSVGGGLLTAGLTYLYITK